MICLSGSVQSEDKILSKPEKKIRDIVIVQVIQIVKDIVQFMQRARDIFQVIQIVKDIVQVILRTRDIFQVIQRRGNCPGN